MATAHAEQLRTLYQSGTDRMAAAPEMDVATLRDLFEQWHLPSAEPTEDAGRLALAGDSAGGNLAISTALRLRAEGIPLPAALLPMSPWLDMEHLGKTLETNAGTDAGTDALVQRSVVQGMSAMFQGATGSPTHPLANPPHADPRGLPPMYSTSSRVSPGRPPRPTPPSPPWPPGCARTSA